MARSTSETGSGISSSFICIGVEPPWPVIVRAIIPYDGSVTRAPESHYVDFVVDGRSLRGILPDAAELVTPLNRPWLPPVPDAIEGLQGQRHTEGLAGVTYNPAGLRRLRRPRLRAGDRLSASRCRDPHLEPVRLGEGYEPATRIDGAPKTFVFDR